MLEVQLDIWVIHIEKISFLWETQPDSSSVDIHWHPQAQDGFSDLCKFVLFKLLATGFHVIWLNLHPPLLSKLDQRFLLPKWPGKGKLKKKKTGTNYILMSRQRLLHIHLDSTQVGRVSAGHTHSMMQECLVMLSQVSHNWKMTLSIFLHRVQAHALTCLSLPTLVTQGRVYIGLSTLEKSSSSNILYGASEDQGGIHSSQGTYETNEATEANKEVTEKREVTGTN